MLRRRRPIATAAVVGGVAARRGRRSAEAEQHNAEQDQEIADLEAQQATGAQPAAAGDDAATQLTKLKALLDSGALTQAEFDAQKAKILAG